jgi:hypothetical protein
MWGNGERDGMRLSAERRFASLKYKIFKIIFSSSFSTDPRRTTLLIKRKKNIFTSHPSPLSTLLMLMMMITVMMNVMVMIRHHR